MPLERPDWNGAGAVVPADDADVPVKRGLDPDLTDALRDPTVARRYQSAVERKFDGARTTWDEAWPRLPVGLVTELDESKAGADHRLRAAQDAALAAFERLGPDERDELISSFNALDGGIRAAILGELSLGSSARGKPVGQADIDRFFATDAGAMLAHEWRHAKAERHIGIVISRIGRILDRLSPGGQENAMAWLDSLSPQTQAAIMRALVQ